MPDFTISEQNPLRIFIEGQPDEPVAGFYVNAAEDDPDHKYARLIIHNGDFFCRNIQGGALTSEKDDLNLDIASGDAAHPGWTVMNTDLGKGVKFQDARGNDLFRIETHHVGTPKVQVPAPIYLRQAYVYNPTTKAFKRLYA